MKFLNWRKDAVPTEAVEQATRTQSELFAKADKVLGEVKRIRRSADALEDYALAEKARLR